jgi:hypothetical protein
MRGCSWRPSRLLWSRVGGSFVSESRFCFSRGGVRGGRDETNTNHLMTPGRTCARAEVRRAGTASSFPEGKCAIRILINSSPPLLLFFRSCLNWYLSEAL